MKRALYNALGCTAWGLCEAAWRTDCWGPLEWLRRLGSAVYTLQGYLGERWGILIPNPRFGEPDQPALIET